MIGATGRPVEFLKEEQSTQLQSRQVLARFIELLGEGATCGFETFTANSRDNNLFNETKREKIRWSNDRAEFLERGESLPWVVTASLMDVEASVCFSTCRLAPPPLCAKWLSCYVHTHLLITHARYRYENYLWGAQTAQCKMVNHLRRSRNNLIGHDPAVIVRWRTKLCGQGI